MEEGSERTQNDLRIFCVSVEDAKRLQEEAELNHIRAIAREDSLEAAQKRFFQIDATTDAARRCFEEAVINLDDDEFDDFETAQRKAEKLERIERELDQAIVRWDNALDRIGYEALLADRLLNGTPIEVSDEDRARWEKIKARLAERDAAQR